MDNTDKVIDFINVNRDRYLEELKALLAIPSISALPEHAGDVKRCAEWCADEMRPHRTAERPPDRRRRAIRSSTATGSARRSARRFSSTATTTCSRSIRSNLWESPPFEATIRDGEIYARGSADDKGQVFMHFKAIEAHLKQNGRLPVNMKFIIEGEEEVGSAHLDDFIRAHKSELNADVVVISDSRNVRARRAVDLLRPARPRVLPDRPARQQHRSALGIVRRRGRQPGVRAGADASRR